MKNLIIAVSSIVTCTLLAHASLAKSIENQSLNVTVTDSRLQVESLVRGELVVPDGCFTHPVQAVHRVELDDETWGKGQSLRLTHDNGWQTCLALYRNCPFLHVSTTAVGPLRMESCNILSYTVKVGSARLRSYGTGGLEEPGKQEGSYAFHAAVDGPSRNGVVSGWLTHDRAVGVFMVDSGGSETDEMSLEARLEFGNYRVKEGQRRQTETLLIGYFEDARLGLEAYADSVAAHYRIQLKPKPCVYCTWYNTGSSNEERIAKNTKYAAQHLNPFGLNVMQIDDGWQAILPDGFEHEEKIKRTGPVKVFVDSKDSYPSGMANTARRISSHGMVPGIWFMPFAGNFRNPYFHDEIFFRNPDGTPFHDDRWSGTCIDSTSPEGAAFVRERVKRLYDWGYRYFKIDGMHTGLGTYNIYVNTHYQNKDFGKAKLHDPGATHVQAYRKSLRILREESPQAFVLGCNVSQNMRCMAPAFGLIDAMRIGPDNGGAGRGHWNSVTKGAWHGTNLYFLNGRIWHNDPDPVYVRPGNPLSSARWMCSWLAVSGAMHTSSEQYSELPSERLNLLRKCLPTHTCTARPVDLFETNEPRIWIARNDRLAVVGLFNWSEKEPASIKRGLNSLGLDASKTYVAFDYWEDQFLEPFSGTLEQTVPAGTCRVLAVRRRQEHPILLSTSRNINQGLTDVLEEKWDAATKTLTGKSRVVAGAAYELRVALPDQGWNIKEATVEATSLSRSGANKTGIRLKFTPRRTGVVRWKICFNNR